MINSYFIVRENSDRDCIYGLLVVKGEATFQQVQNAIYVIKNSMTEEESHSYTINDIVSKLPFDCKFVRCGEVEV